MIIAHDNQSSGGDLFATLSDIVETTAPQPAPRLLNWQPMAGDSRGTDKRASIDDVRAVATPAKTPSWRPMPHGDIIDHLHAAANNNGVRVLSDSHLLARDGNRYFGMFQIDVPSRNGDIASVIGLRNSHDKSMRAAVCAGDAPFICSNLCFSNEIVLGRKHTAGLSHSAVEWLLSEAIEQLLQKRELTERRNDRLRETALCDSQAHAVAVRAMRAGACAPSHLSRVVDQWHEPEHAEFKARNAWSLQNAFSNVWRSTPLQTPSRSAALANVLNRQLLSVA